MKNVKKFPQTPLEAQAFGPRIYHKNPPTSKINETPSVFVKKCLACVFYSYCKRNLTWQHQGHQRVCLCTY